MKPAHLRYKDTQDAIEKIAQWDSFEFPHLSQPILYMEDRSFSHAFGTEHLEELEVSDTVYDGASVQYTIVRCPLRDTLPTPPREIEYRVEWHNETGLDRVTSLPDQVWLWCHMELKSYDVRVIGDSVSVLAHYTYQYSLEPVLDRNIDAQEV